MAYRLCDVFRAHTDGKPSMGSYLSTFTFPRPIQSPHAPPAHFTPLITRALYQQLKTARDSSAKNVHCLSPLYKKLEEILDFHSFS